MPTKKLREPVKFEKVIEEDLSDDSRAESDDISSDEDSSSEEESGGECDEDISYAVQ